MQESFFKKRIWGIIILAVFALSIILSIVAGVDTSKESGSTELSGNAGDVVQVDDLDNAGDDPDMEISDKNEDVSEDIVLREEVRIENNGAYTFYNIGAEAYLSYSDRRLSLNGTPATWQLKDNDEKGFHIYAHPTDLMLDIDNARVEAGTTVKLWNQTGYDVQIWHVERNKNGSYSILYSGDNRYCLGFDDGNAVLQIRDESNKTQEWQVEDISDTLPQEYLSYKSEEGIIELQLPLDILGTISESRLLQWANELETAYDSFYELTNYKPFKKIIVEAYKTGKNPSYAGWVQENSNVLHISKDFLYRDLAKMAARDCDWNFCALHEMGHMFDFGRPWNFESEMMTDLKLAYVLEQNNVAAAPAEFDASVVFYGADIRKAYEGLGSDFSEQYNIFGCTERFMKIKEDIGWGPFKQTFYYLQENEAAYSGATKQGKFETFVDLLSHFSGVDVKSYFTAGEWEAILHKLNG